MKTNDPRTNIEVTIRDKENDTDHVFQYVERVHYDDENGKLVVEYARPDGTYSVVEERFNPFTTHVHEVTTVEQPLR